MNPFRKLYCRTFQTVLKISIPFLPYRKPKVVGSVKALPDLIKKKKCTNVLIITDSSIMKLGLTKRLEKALTEHDIPYTIYDGTVANPTTANVETAAALYLEKGCDAIIGFGGGSSMDCAKGVGIRIAKPKKPLSKMKGILKVHTRLPLLIAVPTTAGTGSETTLAAVITDAVSRHKYAINDFPLIPRYAVLDPKVTVSLPQAITSTTGMDALTHAVEAYIGRSTTRGTKKDALLAVRLIFENIDTAYNEGTDIAARRNMLHASFTPDARSQSPTSDMYMQLPIPWAGNTTSPTAWQMPSCFRLCWKPMVNAFIKSCITWLWPQDSWKRGPHMRKLPAFSLMPSGI